MEVLTSDCYSFFPLLAARMPEFQSAGKGGSGNRRAAALLQQHKEIHAGMDGFEDYLRRCRNRELDFELSVLKEKMDTVSAILSLYLCLYLPLVSFPSCTGSSLAENLWQSGATCCGSISTRRSRRSGPRT